jgi:hypothetical protein
MKPNVLFIILLCLGFYTQSQGQSGAQPSPLSGTWQLESADIKKITEAGDVSNESYMPDVYANPSTCIYPVLRMEAGQCFLNVDGTENIITYSHDIEQGKLTLWYSDPATFTCSFPSANTLSLTREYKAYDTEKRESFTLSAHLIYTKNY